MDLDLGFLSPDPDRRINSDPKHCWQIVWLSESGFFISAFCILSESLNSPITGNEKMRLSCWCPQLGIEYLDNLLEVRFFGSRDSLFIFSTAG